MYRYTLYLCKIIYFVIKYFLSALHVCFNRDRILARHKCFGRHVHMLIHIRPGVNYVAMQSIIVTLFLYYI